MSESCPTIIRFLHTAALALLSMLALASPAVARAGELTFRPQEISDDLTVGYATRILDMNDDGRPDILVVDSKRVIWFENPAWQMHTILEGQTLPDNVAIAPADFDGDGDTDFALAADWRPGDTHASGSLQWLERGASVDAPGSCTASTPSPRSTAFALPI